MTIPVWCWATLLNFLKLSFKKCFLRILTYNFYFIYSKDSNIIVFFSSLIASFWSRNVNSFPATDVAPPLTVLLSPCVILSLFPGGHYQQNLDFMKVPFWSFVLSLINESDSLHKLKIEKRILMYFWQRNKNEKKKRTDGPRGHMGSHIKLNIVPLLNFRLKIIDLYIPIL